MKADENIESYRDIIAKTEVSILQLNSTLKKELKIIENETILCNDLIALMPEKGHSKENYDKIINKLKMIEVLQKQSKIYFVKFD